MKIKSILKIFCPAVALLTGCIDINDQSRNSESEKSGTTLSTAATVTTAVQNGTWYSMNAQAYDVAVASRNWIFIINNYNDICYWQWKNGSFQPGNPAGGVWVKMATIPGGFSRVASSEYNLIAAISKDMLTAYVYNGASWISIGNPGCGGLTDIVVSPSGQVSVSMSTGCVSGGIFDWNGSSWVRYVDYPSLLRLAPTLTSRRFGTNQRSHYTVIFNPEEWHPELLTQDFGGTDERQPRRTWNNYELWRSDMNGNIFHLYTGLFPNGTGDIVDSRWMQTTGRASNIAASKKSEVVVMQGEGRYVYFSSDFLF